MHGRRLSSGKDTVRPLGNRRRAVLFDWGYFSDQTRNSFPQELLDKLKRANLPGYLGNCHSSGTVISSAKAYENRETDLLYLR